MVLWIGDPGPDSDRAHYYQENYPEIWTKTTKTLLTEEEPHVY